MTQKTKSHTFTFAKSAVLLLPLVLVACETEPLDPEGGSPSGASSNEPANPSAASASQGQLVAQKAFNDGTETLSIYDLGGGSFSANWAGNPKGGHSALAQAFMGLKLSEIWELVAASGQAAPPALAAMMTAHPARTNTMATLESQLAAAPPAESPTTPSGITMVASALTATNYCDNGGFFNDFGVTAENNGGWLYQEPLDSALTTKPSVTQYGTTINALGISYTGFDFAATAVCPTNDAGFFNGNNVPAGTGYGIKVWSGEQCGFDLNCCNPFTNCTSCTIFGTNYTWTWVDFCPSSSSFCTDRNITEVVTFQQFLNGGCTG